MIPRPFISVIVYLHVATCVSAEAGAFVHLFEWKWADIAVECETFLGPKGYRAVQVSPPTEHVQGSQWWTRYQPVSYDLVSRSGDETAFVNMVKRCAKAGVGIIVDAVTNHMAAGSGTGVNGTKFSSRSFPLYSPNDFHHVDGDTSRNCAVENYQDAHNVQYCDLVGMPDLCTVCSAVQQKVSKYLNSLKKLGVYGVRMDAAKHMNPTELQQVMSRVSGLYVFQEVIRGNGEAVKPSEYINIGDVTEFGYASDVAQNIVNQGKMQYLSTLGAKWGLLPSESAVVFLDNHDTQRSGAQLTYKSGNLYAFANIFMLAHPYGFPKVMSSYYFFSSDTDQGPPSTPANANTCKDGGSWVCEHRWTPIANMIGWRNSANGSALSDFVAHSGDVISFNRGSKAFIVLNRDINSWSADHIRTILPPGVYCNVIVSDQAHSCPQVIVDDAGNANGLVVESLSAVAIHINAKATLTPNVTATHNSY